ncbi:PLAC8-domain-containing protein [Choiromyces venosus 120613-1]|uniref:PLAC8-domain-containing protein n=1 Tax=Choiromyces venosus 120613-1 TaxID=1336337 RepID=A0A3N4J045_9PEZI|nr:PLAC8-domain-containing protein [Choiromyces venosus 120613-1]
MSGNKFRVGLFDCFSDAKECLIGCCIPGLSYSQTDYRLRTNPSTLEGHEPVNITSVGACGLFYVCGCVGFVLPFLHRQQIRQRYNIAGGSLGDCCVTYWCPACSLIQNEKEVILREREAAAAVVTEQPTAHEAMTYPAK